MSIIKHKKSVTADIREKTEQHTGYFFVLAFLFLTTVIITASYFSYRNYQKNYRAEAEHNLSSIAKLKVDELVDWRQDRLGDASIFFKNPVFTSLVQGFLKNPKNADTRWRIQTWIGKIQANFQYDQVRLLDTQGVTLLSIPANRPPVSSAILQRLPEVLRSGQVTFQDFYRNDYNQHIYLSVLVPIFDEKNHNQPLAVLSLRIDPEVDLYPFIQHWPTDSRTAETLLVRREGNDALFLNELRFQKNTALNLQFSLKKKEIPAVKAVLGQKGIVEGMDYRGVPVVAAISAVPDSPWFLVARMDKSEVYAPVRAHLWTLVGFIIIMLLGTAAFLGFLWRQQKVRFYREHYEAAEALRESQERHQTILQTAMDGFWLVDMQGRLLEVNETYCRMSGYRAQELLAMRVSELEFVESDDDTAARIQRIMVQGEDRFESRHRRKDGSIFDVEVSIHYQPTEGGRLVAFLQDITERKKAEEALRESEERFRLIFDYSNDGIIVVDTTTMKFLFGNQAICRMLGYTPEELRELGVKDIHPPNDLPTVTKAFEKQMRTKEGEPTIDIPVQKKDGSVFYVNIGGFPVKLGDKTCMVGIFRDITERKQMEEERNSLQEQLIRSEKLAAVGELISGVVHEINNPLTGIKGLSELLLNETQDEEKKKDLKFIHESSERIEKIITNLQRFARREESIRKNVNINELIDVVISIRNYEMQARNIKVERDYQPDLPLVMADPSQLEQVFLNLIINAEYAIHNNQEKAGTLTIATSVVPDSAGGKTVVIEFSDTGAGIPIDVLPKLFNPFFTTKGVGKGTGLGLSVSYGIIKEHGGEISAGNRAEGGAVFTIELPVGSVKTKMKENDR